MADLYLAGGDADLWGLFWGVFVFFDDLKLKHIIKLSDLFDSHRPTNLKGNLTISLRLPFCLPAVGRVGV